MRDALEMLLQKAGVPNPERAELLWAEYRTGGSGATRAFNTLLAWYGLAIYRRIWGFVRSDAAEDVFQDVLASLHQQRQKLATFEDALRWLRTVAIRKCVDAHRRTARRKKREAKRAISPDAETPTEQRIELQDVIAMGLSKLPSRQREAIALVYFEEVDLQEAAVVLGVHRDTLAKYLADALERLRGLVPVPVILATGGTLGVQRALAAKPLPLALVRMGELAKNAWVKGVTPAWSILKIATAVALGLAATGGLAAAGWGMIRDREQALAPVVRADPAIKDPTPVVQAAPAPMESVPDRNLRIYRAEVLPKQLAALRGLVIGDGEVELESVEAYEIRVHCVFKLLHKSDNLPGWISRIELEHTTCGLDPGVRWTEVRFDMFGKGAFKPIGIPNPIILWRNPVTRKEIVLKSAGLEAAVAAFDRLPHDDRSEDELRASRAMLIAAVSPYLGVWYAQGNPARQCEVQLNPKGEMKFVQANGPPESGNLFAARIDATGRLFGLTLGAKRVSLSADGRRLEIERYKEWWSREPIREGKK